MRMMGYSSIADYAVIGDGRTAALVSRDGSIDWLCLPHFSGPSVFAAIVDRHRGGRFAVRPAQPYSSSRRYIGHTNVLETTFTTADGAVRLIDLMPISVDSAAGRLLEPQREVLRIIEPVAGTVELEVIFEPRPGYGQARARLTRRGALGWACIHGSELMMLHADLPLSPDRDAARLHARVQLVPGRKRYLSFTYTRHDIGVFAPIGESAEGRLAVTLRWWEDWSGRCTYDGPYHDAVRRSALTLKLMNYALSGAVVAAPTTSLPEKIGGVRNWDYRYCWLRDAALTLYSFFELGYHAEGEEFLDWMLHATRLTWPRLQVLYNVYGETRLRERELNHFEGYRGSSPVRIGNGAHDQMQLDIYGEVIIAVYDYVERGGRLDAYEARLLVGFGRYVCRHWRRPDKGIWEVRSGDRHYTYSKMMCWVALDRLIKLHEMGQLRVPEPLFRDERNAIRDAIESRGFNREMDSYVSAFEGRDLDASLLLLARYGYKSPSDPRMRATFQRIEQRLVQNGLLHRYLDGDDGLPPGEGAFVITSFWLVDYLARLGRIDEATERFEHLLSFANDLGLFSEEVDAETGEALGNFPQAFSHTGLITAALSLAEAQRQRRSKR